MDEASGGVDTRRAETGSLLDGRQMAAVDGGSYEVKYKKVHWSSDSHSCSAAP